MPFTPGMNALIPARLPGPTAHEAMVTGRRYTGGEALSAGIVSALSDEDRVVSDAVALAAPLAGKAGPGIARIRTTLHAPVIALLLDTGTDAAV
jgi:enoyl-CoA hydratase/carnithine racemase